MERLRIASFNAANLYTRADFSNPGSRPQDQRVGLVTFSSAEELRAAKRISDATLTRLERQLTAAVILDTEADFVALQEVDNEEALKLFRDDFLREKGQAAVAAKLKPLLPALRAEATKHPDPDDWLQGKLKEKKQELERIHLYSKFRLFEGNDKRGIDVGYLARRVQVRNERSHAQLTYHDLGLWSEDIKDALDAEFRGMSEPKVPPNPWARVFRRDCVSVELALGNASVTVYNCHFKANPPDRMATYPIRLAEAQAVAAIVRRDFPDPARGNWIICGDLNDYVELDGRPDMPDLITGEEQVSALWPLLGAGPDGLGAFDVSQWIADPTDRWTSYFPRDDVYSQLDHILISPALRAANEAAGVVVPRIHRRGMGWTIERLKDVSRYPGVGLHEPVASDHAAISVDLMIP